MSAPAAATPSGDNTYTPKVRAAFQAFRDLTDDERGLIACWFCNQCWRYVGPGDTCRCWNDGVSTEAQRFEPVGALFKFIPHWRVSPAAQKMYSVKLSDAWLCCESCDFRMLYPRRISGRRARGLRVVHRSGGQHYATWTYWPRKPRGLRKHLRRQKAGA